MLITLHAKRATQLLCLFFSILFLIIAPSTHAQTASLSLKNASLEEAFSSLSKQTGYDFIYSARKIPKTKNITIEKQDAPLDSIVVALLAGLPLTYTIMPGIVILSPIIERPPSVNLSPTQHTVRGRVINEKNEVIPGTTIKASWSGQVTVSDDNGDFVLHGVEKNDVLNFSSVGYQDLLLSGNAQAPMMVQLKIAAKNLDEVIVPGYGDDTRRFNTGSVGKVDNSTITNQPVTNPLLALEGRVAGLSIVQSSGVPGASVRVEIRGRSSLDLRLSRNDPLYIIDGMPFEPAGGPVNQLPSAAGNIAAGTGISAFNCINLLDIEEIYVLKDAAATAIYGSRGANGVIVINTRRGRAGKLQVNLQVSAGLSEVTRTIPMNDIAQYRQSRKEGFSNDRLVMTRTNAPDLLVWDSTRTTDLSKTLMGNLSKLFNIQLAVSGGNAGTQYLLTMGFHRETNVFSPDLQDVKFSIRSVLQQSTPNKKLQLSLITLLSTDQNELIQQDLTRYVQVPPNLILYDEQGKLNWQEGGVHFIQFNGLTNPMAQLLKQYHVGSDFLLANLQVRYRIAEGLMLKLLTGFNHFGVEEIAISPKASFAPTTGTAGFSYFGNSVTRSVMIEPQAEYTKTKGILKGSLLAGITWQQKTRADKLIHARDFTDDSWLTSLSAAGSTSTDSNLSFYKYAAAFARLNMRWQDKYILTATARRDGSSRFGPEQQWANFGAVGAAWILTEEPFLCKWMPVLSFLKCRASLGITGNDQIGDYRYYDTWNLQSPARGEPVLQPSGLYNPGYSWEMTKKLEAAIEAGFFDNQLLITAAWFRNRSSNLLINDRVPDQTGFAEITRNIPAVVQNSGLEWMITMKRIVSKTIEWNCGVTITVPSNRLIAFRNLEASGYAGKFSLGESINPYSGYSFREVDPQTGLYTFEDLDKNSRFPTEGDYRLLGNFDPVCYGGLQQGFTWKNWAVGIFFSFRKQVGRNYFAVVGNNQPGRPVNHPVALQNRWQGPGDVAPVQQYSTLTGSAAGMAAYYLASSNAGVSDASYIRGKNIYCSYAFPSSWCKRWGLAGGRFYLQAQNFFTITNYLGADPETQGPYILPPLKTIVAGIQVQL